MSKVKVICTDCGREVDGMKPCECGCNEFEVEE